MEAPYKEVCLKCASKSIIEEIDTTPIGTHEDPRLSLNIVNYKCGRCGFTNPQWNMYYTKEDNQDDEKIF